MLFDKISSPTQFLCWINRYLCFRRDNLLNVDTLQAAESVLADLSSLPVVPLLQLALEKPRGGRSGAIGAVGGGTLRRFS